jgi:hypothetical protein
MPFAAHGCASRIVSFGVKKNPVPTSRRFCASASVMLLKPPIEIGRPPDIGSVIGGAFTPQDVDVTGHNPSPVAQALAYPDILSIPLERPHLSKDAKGEVCVHLHEA